MTPTFEQFLISKADKEAGEEGILDDSLPDWTSEWISNLDRHSIAEYEAEYRDTYGIDDDVSESYLDWMQVQLFQAGLNAVKKNGGVLLHF